LGVTGATTAYLAASFYGDDPSLFLPGPTTNGHYQIESKCELCHTPTVGVKQEACVGCHAEELERIDDSHPIAKFQDPRNANLLEKLDARKCITCHIEHRPEMTGPIASTQPEDFCQYCHSDIGTERPSHQGMAFDTCQDAGCHNFHDNLALNEEFVRKHLDEAELKDVPVVVSRGSDDQPHTPLSRAEKDSPADMNISGEIIDEWEQTAHAKSGVNCTDCHARVEGGGAWSDAVDHEVCAACHAQERKGFIEGRHGMRLAQGLSPMRPGLARLPMHSDVGDRELVCTHCHGAHDFDTRRAAAEACLECHADQHSVAYKDSPHYRLWRDERSGASGTGSGVSCATCHMPRLEERRAGKTVIVVDHNQNNTQRPNEKMIRPVCMQCHGLGFSINSLADPTLIRSNFKGQPDVSVNTLELVKKGNK
jgi:hypothetical protein